MLLPVNLWIRQFYPRDTCKHYYHGNCENSDLKYTNYAFNMQLK